MERAPSRGAAEGAASSPSLAATRALTGLLIGLAGGGLGSLVGLGGGVVMIPLLTSWMGLTQHAAHGSSLVAVLFTAVSGGVGYARQGAVDLTAAVAVAASAMLMARVGARASGRVSSARLQGYFGMFLVGVSLLLPVSRYVMAHVDTGLALPSLQVVAGGLVIGVISGYLAGMMGVGGGAIVVPALVVGLGFPQHLAQGTSLIQMIPTAVSGTWTHHRLGHIQWPIAPWLGVGAIAGGWVGATVAGWLPSPTLRYVFSAFTLLMGVHYIRRSRRALAADGRVAGRTA
ncbi:sulfite exporter TauE/SafE family protein [Geochorda subterranea]|uniref:Probable membrane transporter protein n=1 Tax=Geochorda subterranea TaxID=3109564 RepID=A0ABZ1BSP1_9FIRM|nr:sulfite exporter TauE/SafE family protein [Limnochorda sp. LNt]WRP15651.1 sulfite exporter TauE/SafE family protein [Limnochorda sp. LNt]